MSEVERFRVTVSEDKDNKWRDGSVLRVIIDGRVVREEYDHGEPEDNSFVRDWGWVAGCIEAAYRTGREHEREEGEAARRGL